MARRLEEKLTTALVLSLAILGLCRCSSVPAHPSSNTAALDRIGTIVVTELGNTLSLIGTEKGPTVLKYVEARYPEEARKARVVSFVNLEVLADEDGRVASIQVIRSGGSDFDSAAVTAVRKWRFAPPLRNGSPLPVLFQMTINFALPK